MPELPTFAAYETIEEQEPDTDQVNPLFYGAIAYFADIQQQLEDVLDGG